ncbi:hypothetical protein ASE61_21580 [Bosea sp. Root670]|nr:hypothetical protein ASE61_21580 [Bosea sp. Root670]
MLFGRAGVANVQQVSATGYGFDQEMIGVTQLVSQLANALNERVIRDSDIWPYDLKQFPLRHQPSSILGKVTENLERLGP